MPTLSGNIRDGAVYVGWDTGSTANTTLTVTGQLYDSTTGIAVYTGSQGAIIVTGAQALLNSFRIYVGTGGSGNLTVSQGGTVFTSSVMYIGQNATSDGVTPGQGNVTITGTGSRLNAASTLIVGENLGDMNIGVGGNVTCASGLVGTANFNSIGTIEVHDPGSAWTITTGLTLGSNGTGILHVYDGATTQTVDGYLGQFPGSAGTVLVANANSEFLVSGNLAVGVSGNGNVSISENGNVSVNGDLVLAQNATAVGLMHVSTNGTLTVGGNATINANGAFYGSAVVNGTLMVGQNGTLSPAIATPFIVANGNATLEGTSAFKIDDAVHFSRLALTGNGTLQYGGMLAVTLAQTLALGNFTLFTFTNQAGDFSTVTVDGAFTGDLVDDGTGFWTGNFSGINIAFDTTTGRLSLALAGSPSFMQQPADRQVLVGQNAAFAVKVNPWAVSALQWQRLPAGSDTWIDLSNDATFTGTLTDTLSINSVTLLMSGDQFRCVATNALGSTNCDAVILSVTPPAQAAAISLQPKDQKVRAGTDALFTVTASGQPPPGYQWQIQIGGTKIWKNIAHGGVFSGATTATLTIHGATSAMTGNQFRCVVVNSTKSVTSQTALLLVTAVTPPSITTQPAAATAHQNTTVKFSVKAAGTAPLTYQWQRNNSNLTNGTNISGATTATLTLGHVTAASAGSYRVSVTNSAGRATSSSVKLTIK